MDHVIASAGLRLTYLRDWSSIKSLNFQKILDELVEPDTRYALYGWFARVSLTDFDHVALATNIETGRHVALLVANDGDTAAGPYLDLRAAIVIDAMRGSMLMRRLLAYAVLRIDSLGNVPRVIAAQTSMPACYRLLSLFARSIPGASIFPDPNTTIVAMDHARLARQVARHAVPHLPYECGTGAIRGAKLTNATCFARKTGADPLVEGMFEKNLGSGDQMMVIVSLQSCDEKSIAAETRTLVRSRWKIPSLPLDRITTPNHRVRRRSRR